jgi:hypothetical protein
MDDHPLGPTQRIGPANAAVVRAVARHMLPSDRAHTPEEVDIAAAILMPAIVSGETTISLHMASSRSPVPPCDTVEVRHAGRVVASFPWSELDLDTDERLVAPDGVSDLFSPTD